MTRSSRRVRRLRKPLERRQIGYFGSFNACFDATSNTFDSSAELILLVAVVDWHRQKANRCVDLRDISLEAGQFTWFGLGVRKPVKS